MREEDLAAAVVAHFDALGQVFPEVSCWSSGPRCDLVVVRSDASLDVVECKRGPTESLRRQIGRWGAHADRLWVAYEPPRRGEVGQKWLHRFKSDGIGTLLVVGSVVTVAAEPKEQDVLCHFRARLLEALTPLHAAYGRAGNAASAFYSPFRHTCDNLRRVVTETPGVTMREAVERIGHHYTSDKVARSALLSWIRNRKVRGVEARIEGGKARLFLSPLSREKET